MKNKIYKITSFYSFSEIKEEFLERFRLDLLRFEDKYLSGLIIIAKEGINGTICGDQDVVDSTLNFIERIVKTNKLNEKVSFSEKKAFKKLKVKIKPEIVTMGISHIDPTSKNGKYVDPIKWNKLLEDQDTIVIDTRNNYEVSLGTFKKSINPNTRNFRDFPKWVDKYLKNLVNDKHKKKIAMFCTGGIRCEKASSLLLEKGYENVFHLKGGILKYLEEISNDNSLFDGECYVFDERVSLNQSLKDGSYSICHACGMPVSIKDKEKDEYKEGIQCHLCIDKFSDEDRKRFAERQRQIDEKKLNL